MAATLSGNVVGNQVQMGAVMGNASFGQASFTGTVVPGGAGTPGGPASGNTISGTFTTTSGPFTGTGGTWSAAQVAAVAVPSLGEWGLLALSLLLLATAIATMRRRQARLAGR